MSDIQEEQKRLYKRAEENDLLREIEEYKEIEKYFIKENKELQDRINKAIEYIDKWKFEVAGNGACMEYEDIQNLLNILQGDDKK